MGFENMKKISLNDMFQIILPMMEIALSIWLEKLKKIAKKKKYVRIKLEIIECIICGYLLNAIKKRFTFRRYYYIV